MWSSNLVFAAVSDPLRYSPAIHVNQVGYLPLLPKKAMVGYYLGSAGELPAVTGGFSLVDSRSGATVFQGTLTPRPDAGYSYTPTPYQQVLEADFSAYQTPGEYKLVVPGLGASLPFLIDEGVAAAWARTYALGMYHQRCGTNNVLPFTRFVHDDCHTAAASIPLPASAFTNTWNFIQNYALEADPLQTAPALTNAAAQLYPFVKQGTVDVSGGHHDAGDYSKYTINSALFIHYLVFTVDAVPGAAAVDNLGIPESGDGISDLLQEAKWEADFLAKMQDADGGFYFLVYPRNRCYETDVLPDHGDPQVVFPKTTAVTASAVGALADMASSPAFKAAYPVVASNYLYQAKLGWMFLTNAIARYGRTGAYQKITHYGDTFIHNDELAWAAAALYAATGDPVYDNDLRLNTPNPNCLSVREWDWLSLYQGYGCAFRDYAFAARVGKLAAGKLDSNYLALCQAEIQYAADYAVGSSADNAYGSSFSDENKGLRVAGWYFSGEQTFDLAVGYLLNPQPAYLDVILKNYNYENGCNPVNVSRLTGTGWKRQREIVSQYAQNDRRVLPPSGIPLGNIADSFGYMNIYATVSGANELEALTYPSDNANTAPYPMYDRWADSYNVATEFVVASTARSLAGAVLLMNSTSVRTQAWQSAAGQITGLPALSPLSQAVTVNLSAAGLDLSRARIVWEARDQEPYLGWTNNAFTFTPKYAGPQWVEAEAQLPDGRRVFAAANFIAVQTVTNTIEQYQSQPLAGNSNVVAWYTLDSTWADAAGHEAALTPAGNAVMDTTSFAWPNRTNGAALRFYDLGDQVTVNLPNADLCQSGTTALSVEAMIFINGFKAYSRANELLFSLTKTWNAQLVYRQDMWGQQPYILGGAQTLAAGAALTNALTPGQWHYFQLALTQTGYSVTVDGVQITNVAGSDLKNWGGGGSATLVIGNFDGWIDEIIVKNSGGQVTNTTPPTSSSGDTNTSPPTLTSGTNYVTTPVVVDTNIVALYHLDGSFADATGKFGSLTPTNNAGFDTNNLAWMTSPSGAALRVYNLGDGASVTLTNVTLYNPNVNSSIAIEAMVFINQYKGYSLGSAAMLQLYKGWNSQLLLGQDKWGTSAAVWGGVPALVDAATLANYLQTNCWQKIGLWLDATGYSVRVNDVVIASVSSGDITNWVGSGNVSLQIGNFDGWIDEVVVRSNGKGYVPATPTASPPVVTLTAPDANASELGPDPGNFLISRAGDLSTNLMVNYTISGSAINGTDYSSIASSATIPAGSASTAITITPLADSLVESNETVILTLATNAGYTVGSPSSATVTIVSTNQTINFAALAAVTYGSAPFALTATASSSLPVSYISGNPAVATVSGSTVTIVGAGTTLITASQAGNSNYSAAAPVSQMLTVAPAPATVTLSGLSAVYDGTAKAASVSTVPSGLPVSVTYNGNATIPVNAGSYTVVATVNSSNYTGSASGTLVITQPNQTINFAALAAVTYGSAPFALTATASSSLPVSYISGNPAVATVSGSTVTIVGAGTTLITASQAGNSNYSAAAPVSQMLTVAPAPATVTLSGLSAVYDGTAKAASVSTVPSGLPVSVTYNGNATIPVNAGSYTVVATVNSSNYTGSASGTLTIASPVTPSITAPPQSQTVLLDPTRCSRSRRAAPPL